MYRGAWWAIVHGVPESDMTGWLAHTQHKECLAVSPRSQRLSSLFSSWSSIVLGFIYRSRIYLSKYDVWSIDPIWKIYIYPVIPAPFAEDCLFLPKLPLHFCQNQLFRYVWVYFWTLFHQTICLSLCQYHSVLMNIILY